MRLTTLILAAMLLSGTAAQARDAQTCLANVIYREARGESRAGQQAVAHVVLNRVKDPAFPDSICAVVRQPGQFAPRASGRPLDEQSYDRAKVVARNAIRGVSDDPTGGATYFHAGANRPKWSWSLVGAGQIGKHRFYRPSR